MCIYKRHEIDPYKQQQPVFGISELSKCPDRRLVISEFVLQDDSHQL